MEAWFVLNLEPEKELDKKMFWSIIVDGVEQNMFSVPPKKQVPEVILTEIKQ